VAAWVPHASRVLASAS